MVHTMESKFESLWIDTSATTNYPTLDLHVIAQLQPDIVIIGGGIAGLTAAYFLQKNGKKVVVLEAERIVCGTTGYTTAKLTIQHEAKYSFLKQNFGIEKARLYAQSNQWAIEEVEKIITEE